MTRNSDAPLYADVVVDAPLPRVFQYKVPQDIAALVEPGDRADIMFGPRRSKGFIVGLTHEPSIDPSKIRMLNGVSGPEERIPQDLLDLSRWIARYYNSSWGQVLAAAVPKGVKEGVQEKNNWQILLPGGPELARAAAQSMAKSARRRAEFLTLIAQWHADNPDGTLLYTAPAVYAFPQALMQLRRLEELGHVQLRKITGRTDGMPAARPHDLTTEQQQALNAVTPVLDACKFATFLLHGATGSGKTEVYIRLIEHTLRLGRGALVLVPEISLTPQTVARFRARFGQVSVLHSNLAEGERAGHWRRLCSGEVRVAVGARSAVFAPVRNLGIVIVDEEHEPSYKQDGDPRYNARDVAVMRAHITGAVAVLGSATPCLESWHNAATGKYTLLSMPTRPGGAKPPVCRTVDLRQEWKEQKRPVLLSRELEQELAACLERGEQAILFLNRRGYNTLVRCPECGSPVECRNCDVAMTYHRAAHLFRCGCCGEEIGVPDRCPVCNSPELRYGGAGTEKIEDVLAQRFPNARLVRMDSDTMSGRDAYSQTLDAFAAGEYDILLGTQMVAKGLDFPNVTLVGVLMADGALGMSDFRAAERTFQLVTQVVGRAGRAQKNGLAIVQAFQPDHPAVDCAVRQDYAGFVQYELPNRRQLSYPPCGKLARIIISGEHNINVRDAAAAAGENCRALLPQNCRMLGPAAPEVERQKNQFLQHILLFAPTSRILADWIAATGIRPGLQKGIRFVLDIDPVSML